MIKFLVDKLHVATSDLELLRHFYKRLASKPEQLDYKHKKERKKIYRQALEIHHENRKLFTDFRF